MNGRASPLGVGALSGGLAALALPPYHLWPLVFVALVPLARFLGRPGRPRQEVVAAGLAFGALYYGLLLYWVPFTLHGIAPLGSVSGLLFLAILAGIAGMQSLLLRHLLAVRGAPTILALPAVWAGTEFVLANAGPLALPWTPLALALTPVPELAGIGEGLGVGGVTFWIAAVNGGVTGFWARGSPFRADSRSRSLAALTLVVALAPAGWGMGRAGRIPLEALPHVILVQMSLPRAELEDTRARDAAAAASLDRILGASWPPDVAPAFVLLPEAPFGSTWAAPVADALTGHARVVGVPLVAGTLLAPGDLSPPGAAEGRRNGVVVVDPTGSVQLAHAKVRLIPGVERPGTRPGTGGAAFDVHGLRLGALICFESAFGAEARRLRRDGAELLVNPSNDGWFRPDAAGGSAAALAQHRGHLVLRAVETRAGAVRSSLGGEILVIDPVGRVVHSRPRGGEGIVAVQPVTSPVLTASVRFGDLGGLAALLLLLGLFIRGPRGVRGALREAPADTRRGARSPGDLSEPWWVAKRAVSSCADPHAVPSRPEDVMSASMEELLEGLNTDLAAEYQAVITYRLFASLASGPYRHEIREFFEEEIPDELSHAQFLADKIVALGGMPTGEALPVKVTRDNREMLEIALAAEKDAIERYEKRVAQAEALGETALKVRLEDLIVDETGHKEEIERRLHNWRQ